MLKPLHSIIILITFTASTAFAQSTQPVAMSDSQLDNVAAGDGCCYTPPRTKGNNGWGNGADPTNPGSSKGRTAPSKLANGTSGPRPNTNPTRSTGR